MNTLLTFLLKEMWYTKMLNLPNWYQMEENKMRMMTKAFFSSKSTSFFNCSCESERNNEISIRNIHNNVTSKHTLLIQYAYCNLPPKVELKKIRTTLDGSRGMRCRSPDNNFLKCSCSILKPTSRGYPDLVNT